MLARARGGVFCAVMRIQDGFPPLESYIFTSPSPYSPYFSSFYARSHALWIQYDVKMHSAGAGGALKSITLQLHKINKNGADYCAPPYGASVRGRCTSGSQQVVSIPLLCAFAPVTHALLQGGRNWHFSAGGELLHVPPRCEFESQCRRQLLELIQTLLRLNYVEAPRHD